MIPNSLHLCALAAVALSAMATVLQADALSSPNPDKYDSYHIGNSYTLQGGQRSLISEIANAMEQPHDYSMSTILGARISYIYDNPEGSGGWEGEDYRIGLDASNAWEALVLQIYGTTDPAASRLAADTPASVAFYDMARSGNPDCQLFVYAIWPKLADWDNPPDTRTSWYAEQFADAIAAEYVSQSIPEVRIIPVGRAILEVGNRIDAGLVPGLSDKAVLYSDGGHLGDWGQYVAALSHVACFFNIDIRNPIPRPAGANHPSWDFDETTAAAVRSAVWDAVSTYPRSGVTAELTVVDALLPIAVDGESYTHTLSAANGLAPYTWSVASGNLPAGMTLSSSGTLSGTPTGVGNHILTLEVADADNAITQRELTLIVESDLTPSITTPALPILTRGTPVQIPIDVTGGNGSLTWDISTGSLPYGLSLQQNGVLSGTPGVAGNYAFTLRVTDADTGTPDSGTRSFSGSVSPADASTFIARQTSDELRLNGLIDDAVWSASTTIGTVLQNAPSPATFDAVWDAKRFYAAVVVDDLTVASGDAVEIFIDGLNDKEVIYNNDDRHLTVSRDGTITSLGGRLTGVVHAVAERPTGYTVELSITWAGLELPRGANDAIGFDVIVTDAGSAGTGVRSWRGDALNREDPSRFGNLLLDPSTVGTGIVYPFLEQGGQLVIEAEDFSYLDARADPIALPNWFFGNEGIGYVGNGYISATPTDNGTGSWGTNAEVGFDVQVATSGTYTMWVRRLGGGGGTNSVFWGIDGNQGPGVDNAEVFNQWTWQNLGSLSMTTGAHQVQFRRREDNYRIDRFVLTTNTTLTPTGDGPSTSPKAGATQLLTITPPSLPTGTLGEAFSHAFETTHADGAVEWSLVSGALPNGVNLSSDGTLSGTPQQFGSYSFALQVEDASGAIDRNLVTWQIASPHIGAWEQWLQDRSLPIDSATTDDPDGDGWTLLQAFAFGDPKVFLPLEFVAPGATSWSIQSGDVRDVAGLEVMVEISDDLSAWSDADETYDLNSAPGDAPGTVRWTVMPSLSQPERPSFARIRVLFQQPEL